MHTNTVLHAVREPLTLTLRRAEAADLPAVLALLAEAAAWLNARGVRQWPTGGFPASRIEPLIAAGTLYVVEGEAGGPLGDGPAAGPIATIALDGYADPEFWTAEDRPEDAYYVHKLCTARACSGLGIGRALLDWAGRRTLADGLRRLRLDCAKTNAALQGYYRSLGFRHVRTVDLPHRASGALFERPAGAFGGYGGPRIIDLSADLSDGLSADLVAEAPAALPGDGLVLTR
jgi:ribosomal protein S18 acetylase RimI-like enzyme